MKKIRFRFSIAPLVMAALGLAFAPGAMADRQPKADAVAILTAGKWHFKGKHFEFDCVFDPAGTMKIEGFNGKDSSCKWKADYKEIVMTFSYYQEVLLFPIDPKGTSGVDAWGDEFTATMPGGASVAAAATPAPTGLDALKPASTPAPAVSAQSQTAAIIAQLTAKKWLFTGKDWTEKRKFNPDGTLSINGKAPGVDRWQIVGNQVVMTFSDRKEILSLPLDPNGTTGTDGFGFELTAVQVADAPTGGSVNTWKPSSSGGSYFGTSGDHSVPAPAPTP